MQIRFRWKGILRLLLRSKKDPESLSRGLGLGLFVGMLPILGFQVVVAYFVARTIRANRWVAVLATLVSNPFTTVPLTVFCLWVGAQFYPDFPKMSLDLRDVSQNLWKQAPEVFEAYVLGCIVTGLGLGAFGYLSLRIFFLFSSKFTQTKRSLL